MTLFDEDELEGLLDSLRNQPGFITAAVVPGSFGGDALVERIRGAIKDFPIEVADPEDSPRKLGERAKELGQTPGAIFILPLDGRRIFQSESDLVSFWTDLNFRREALGTGNIRTCLLLNEETERGLALVADDLWDWVTIFRFPEALPPRGQVKEPGIRQDTVLRGSKDKLDIYSKQWQRARDLGISEARGTHGVSLFLELVDRGQYDEALHFWDVELNEGKAVQKLGRTIHLKVLAAAADLGLYDYAISEYQKALGEKPEDLQVRVQYADCLKQFRQFEEALTAYHEASKKILDRFGRSPDFLAILEKRSEVLGSLGRWEEALEVIQEAINEYRNLASEKPEVFRRHLARSLGYLGKYLLALGQVDRALEATQEAVEILRRPATHKKTQIASPELAKSLRLFGSNLGEIGRREEALEATQEAVALYRQLAEQESIAFGPDLSWSLANLGNCLGALGRIQEAFESSEEAVRRMAPFFLGQHALYHDLMAAIVKNYQLHAAEAGTVPDSELLTPILEALRGIV